MSETKNVKKLKVLKALIKEISDIVNAGIEEYEHSIELQVAIEQAINFKYFLEKWLPTSK